MFVVVVQKFIGTTSRYAPFSKKETREMIKPVLLSSQINEIPSSTPSSVARDSCFAEFLVLVMKLSAELVSGKSYD